MLGQLGNGILDVLLQSQSCDIVSLGRRWLRDATRWEALILQNGTVELGIAHPSWSIGLELLREKCSANSHLRSFRSQIKEIGTADTLPEYRMMNCSEKDQVTFYIRDAKKLIAAVASGKSPLLEKKFG